jgi:hypothetical protein
MRLYDAIVELIQAHAARVRTETLDAELEYADWARAQADDLEE